MRAVTMATRGRDEAGTWAASGSWTRQGHRLSSGAFGRTRPASTSTSTSPNETGFTRLVSITVGE